MNFKNLLCLLNIFCFSSISLAQNIAQSVAQNEASENVDAEHMAKDNQTTPEVEMKPEEEAPPAEAPYPNAKTEESLPTPTIEPKAKLTPKTNSGPMTNLAPKVPFTPKATLLPIKQKAPKLLGKPKAARTTGNQIPLNIDRPKSIDDDGNYIYERSKATDEVDVSKQATTPLQYGKEGPLKITPPLEVKKNGDFFYGYEKSPHNYSASIKFGLYPAPNLENQKSGTTFKQLYTDKYVGCFLFDYEKQFHRSFGDLGIRIGTGVFFANGSGRFVNQADPERDPATVPDVSFNFVMLPNTIVALYHMRYSESQILTPYFGGGAGYFVFSEIRDDNRTPKFAGAAVGVGVGGINIMVDGLDANSARQLEANYGVNHASVSLEFTQILGVHPQYNFTGSVLNAGFNLEF